MRAIRKHQPRVVLGAGGFASGPGGIAAWLLRRPLVMHEQNAVAGLTNRVLARFAQRVLEGFPGSFGRGVQAERVGNPVRPEIVAVAPPERRYAGREGRLRLLVFGGSQGAARLNAVVPAAHRRTAGGRCGPRCCTRPAGTTSRRPCRPIARAASRRTCGRSSTTWRAPTAGPTSPCAAPAR